MRLHLLIERGDGKSTRELRIFCAAYRPEKASFRNGAGWSKVDSVARNRADVGGARAAGRRRAAAEDWRIVKRLGAVVPRPQPRLTDAGEQSPDEPGLRLRRIARARNLPSIIY